MVLNPFCDETLMSWKKWHSVCLYTHQPGVDALDFPGLLEVIDQDELVGLVSGDLRVRDEEADGLAGQHAVLKLLPVADLGSRVTKKQKLCFEDIRQYQLTLCLPSTNPPCATLFWGTLELGRHLEVLCSTCCIFLPVNCMENSKKPN